MMYRRRTHILPVFLAAIFMAGFFVSSSLAQNEPFSSADAARALRKDDALKDWTGNGTIDKNDVKAMLLTITGRADSAEQLQDCLKTSLLGEKYLEMFSYNKTVQMGHNYYSSNVSITVTDKTYVSNLNKKVVCHIADIYIRNIFCLRTGLANNTFGSSETVENMAREQNALLAVNGDYCSQRRDGTIIRNGTLYRKNRATQRDTCAILYDGRMKLYPAGSYTADDFNCDGVYQSWCFGPSLLDENSHAKSRGHFITNVFYNNPRCALGYYEPGHYCLVVVDGRGKNDSHGLDMEGLSALMEELGCKSAYNMDGGATAVMVSKSGNVNKQTDKSRACSDIIYIIDNTEKPSVSE